MHSIRDLSASAKRGAVHVQELRGDHLKGDHLKGDLSSSEWYNQSCVEERRTVGEFSLSTGRELKRRI